MADYVMHSCDVCEAIDYDRAPKLAKHCGGCKAWICKACEFNYPRRAEAMLRRAKSKMRATAMHIVGKQ